MMPSTACDRMRGGDKGRNQWTWKKVFERFLIRDKCWAGQSEHHDKHRGRDRIAVAHTRVTLSVEAGAPPRRDTRSALVHEIWAMG